MSTQRKLPPGAREVVLPNGQKRIEMVIDLGPDPATGRRRQSRRRFRTATEARDAYAEIRSTVRAGTHVRRSRETLAQAAAAWLAGKRNLKASTRAGYEHALEPVLAAYGAMPVQRLTKRHIDDLVTALAEGMPLPDGRRRRPWTGRTVSLLLFVLGKVLDDLMRQGQLVRNVATLVERPRHRPAERDTWTVEEVRAFLAVAKADRLHVAWLLALYGLRRGEIAGLRWADVDLNGTTGTLKVVATRLAINGRVITDDPKSEHGRRTLPLTAALAEAFRERHRAQAAERIAVGPAYAESGLIVVDEAGNPLRPERLTDRFGGLARQAGVRQIRLHDARHTCGTLMHLAGEPAAAISAWLGHSSPAFTMRTYVHSQTGALNNAAATLDRVFEQ